MVNTVSNHPALIDRRCASAWARTLAKPVGFVMRAAWPASELAQRLRSSNSTTTAELTIEKPRPAFALRIRPTG